MKYDLEKILPHSRPMILIDDICEINMAESYLTSEVTIDSSSLFFEKEINGISYLAGIEFMAQTIACYAYFKNNNTRPEIGLLLGTRSYKSNIEKFEDGKTYQIKAKEIYCDDELVSFECLIYNEGTECAKAVINAYQPQDTSKVLNSGSI